jgi:hypothetical protein
VGPCIFPSHQAHRSTFSALLFLCLSFVIIYRPVDAQTHPEASQSSSTQAQEATPRTLGGLLCEPAPQIQAALDVILKRKQAPDQSDYEFWRAQRTAIQGLRKQYPNNFFVEREYVANMVNSDPSTGGFPSEAGILQVTSEYKTLREQRPDDTIVEYLYATLLVDRDTPAAIQLFDDVLRKEPGFPWPHNDLVPIYSSPNFLDRAKQVAHLSAFLSACPANVGAYGWMREIEDDELIRKIAPQFRRLLETRTDPDALWEYQTLWSLEFKSHPSSDYAALRKQVASDLARIRPLNLKNDVRWWYVLSQGYQLADDPGQAKWAQEELNAHARSDFSPASQAIDLWLKDHPYPKPDDSKEKKLAHSRDELKQSDEWVKKWPNSRDVWEHRMSSMAALDDVPAADCAATLEKRLQLEQANNGPMPLYWWTYFEFADFLSQKNVEPAREVELAQKAVDTIAGQWENIPQKDLNSTKDDVDYYPNFYWPLMKARALLYEVEGYTRLKNTGEALAALGKVSLQLQAMNSDLTADESRRGLHNRDKEYHRSEFQYWRDMARVAELQNRKTDAMAYYQSALVSRFDSDKVPVPEEKDELGDEAHKLWALLGGTDDGWNAWYGRRVSVLAKQTRLDWENAQEPLPSFELTDLHGRTWKPENLKGKVVFLNFWASW